MDQREFDELHTSCVSALADYVTSAELTATMLARCTPEPLPLEDRLNLMVQEIAEAQVHSVYLDLKRILHDAARLGYHFSN
ncbi:MAG: hypothetical protein PVS2B2_19810 [Candidatus Acidiferrum sp.]